MSTDKDPFDLMTVELTEAEKGALWTWWNADFPAPSVLCETVARLIAARMADAWDEGYQDGYEDNGGPNPYRVQEDPVTTDHAAQKLAEMRDLRGISTTEHEETES